MLDEARSAIAPFYLYIKFIHVLTAAFWAASTSVAWVYYLKPAFRAVHRNPDDPVRRARLHDLMVRMDRGVVIEHVAFPLLVLTALLMLFVLNPDLTSWNFMSVKFWIGVAILVPMEAFDYYLSHMGGNKEKIRATGDTERYERVLGWHWIFFRATEPVVVVIVPLIFFLAIVKPF